MSRTRGIGSLLLVLGLLSTVAAAVVWRLVQAEDAPPVRAGAPRPELPDTEGVEVASTQLFGEHRPVEGAAVVRDTLWVQVVGSGVATASRQSRIATRAAGLVQSVYVREGELVRKGDLLVQLDTAQATMNLIRARANLTRAEAQFEHRMLMGGASDDLLSSEERATRERVVRAETGLTDAELTLAEREIELEFTRVRAPFTGRIADLRTVEGAFLQNGDDVLTLVQLDPIRVVVDVLENEIGLVSVGRGASVRFNALGAETRAATVESVNPKIDPATRTGRVTLALPNPDGRIVPGNYAWASLQAEPFPDRILVPREAITSRGENRDVVFVLTGADAEGLGIASWNYVAVGRRNDTFAEIVPSDDGAMLQPGQIVLVNGHHYLAHNTPVRVVENIHLAGGTPGR